MAKKYNFSIQRLNGMGFVEALQVEGCDSFDEAIRIVERAVHDRELTEPKIKLPEHTRPTISSNDKLSNPNNESKTFGQ